MSRKLCRYNESNQTSREFFICALGDDTFKACDDAFIFSGGGNETSRQLNIRLLGGTGSWENKSAKVWLDGVSFDLYDKATHESPNGPIERSGLPTAVEPALIFTIRRIAERRIEKIFNQAIP